MLALDPDAGEATHKTLQLFGRKHGGDPVWSLCEITDLAGHPVIVMRQGEPEDRSDRGSARNQTEEDEGDEDE
jgi:hypothetical protein